MLAPESAINFIGSKRRNKHESDLGGIRLFHLWITKALTNLSEFYKLMVGMKIILANNLILFTLVLVLFFGAMSFSLSRVLYRINN
jgi:hypothetical protein